MQRIVSQQAPDPGRHHVGTPGDIISECPGDFVGIRTEGAIPPRWRLFSGDRGPLSGGYILDHSTNYAPLPVALSLADWT
jgi:hypothetical protein